MKRPGGKQWRHNRHTGSSSTTFILNTESVWNQISVFPALRIGAGGRDQFRSERTTIRVPETDKASSD